LPIKYFRLPLFILVAFKLIILRFITKSMDLKKLYDSLSLDEKKELRGYLNDEFISNDDLYLVEWCIRYHPSVRLQNILCNNFKARRVASIKEKEFKFFR
jgi:hypothetical protein